MLKTRNSPQNDKQTLKGLPTAHHYAQNPAGLVAPKSKKRLKEQRICAYINIATYLTRNYTFCAPNLIGY